MGIISRVNVSWLIYSFLLLFRIIIGPFLLGYIHPDEFFQGGQELFFGCPPNIPWEFEAENALRSILPPILMTWFPLKIYNWLRVLVKMALGRHELIARAESLSGTEVLVVPRIACSFFSIFAIDSSVWYICEVNNTKKTRNGGVPIPVLLLSSAWPTMLMLTRPFSNSMESNIFAVLIATVLAIKTNDEYGLNSKSSVSFFSCWKVGTICALGIFTRFTFVFFASPILLFLLNDMVQTFGVRRSILWRKLGWMTLSFLCTSFGIIQADTVFYSSRRDETTTSLSYDRDIPSLFDYSSLVVTPLNALAYNSKISNLKDHGLHPRWTHAVVNMLIMYGPLALGTYLLMTVNLISRCGFITRTNHLNWMTIDQGHSFVVFSLVVIFGLGFLSIAPHQEPRFLLPLLIPLVLLGERSIRHFPTTGVFFWIFFNFLFITFFGVLHQGGVAKSLLAIGSTTEWTRQDQPTSWIYFRTYMPPTFLTRLSRDALEDTRTCSNYEQRVCHHASFDVFGMKLDESCQSEKVHIIDLKSSSLNELRETIQIELPCSNRVLGPDLNAFLYLVIPLIEENDKSHNADFILSSSSLEDQFQLSNEMYEWSHVDSYGPHLTTEDLPPFDGSFINFYNNLALDVYRLSCAVVVEGVMTNP